jgi:hypothetical protein
MSALATIYDFETPIESAFAALLAAQGLTAKATADSIDFQSDRPRVEVQFNVTGANDSRQFACPDGVHRHDLYSGTLTLAIITESGADTTHAEYRAKVRTAMSGAYSASMADLEIRYLVPQSSTPAVRPEDNLQVSNLTYEVRFGIKPTAWPA